MAVDAQQNKRFRGAILEILNARHSEQKSKPDHVMLWHIMVELQFSLGENDLITLLQDLYDRGLLQYDERRDRKSNAVSLFKLRLTPRGRDLCEGTASDPAVHF